MIPDLPPFLEILAWLMVLGNLSAMILKVLVGIYIVSWRNARSGDALYDTWRTRVQWVMSLAVLWPMLIITVPLRPVIRWLAKKPEEKT